MFDQFFSIFGWLAYPIAISTTITILLLGVAVFFAFKYTLAFYGDRPTPKSWILIITALVSIVLAETGEFFVLLNITPGIIDGSIDLSAHIAAGVTMTLGCYYLYKEVV